MPSFLNKVFGYRKHESAAHPTRDAADDDALLDGKYEAVPPVVSAPSPVLDASDRDLLAFSLFKSKSRPFHKSSRKDPAPVPHLTLQLPAARDKADSRTLGVVFADPDSQTLLDDALISEKRLSPLEALVLIRACAQAITERGLETLGIMHPHWSSASPDIQRKLISLFIRSLSPSPRSRTTTLPQTPTTPPSSPFEDELRYTRLPQDVAAVFRWGLRHLSLDNGQFGKDADWTWYNTFFHAERNASYPPKAFSELLLPQLPAPHVELLTAMLNLISSLAAHAEVNGISGSKLSKFMGFWLLVATRAEQSDDWFRFYARWERAGRILEHLFLARLREESFRQRLPPRLQELVTYYPYSQGIPITDDHFLSRPRFSTRHHDALLVRVESLLSHGAKQPKQHPIQLLLEAFQLPVESHSKDEHTSFWYTLKSTVSGDSPASDAEGPQFSRIFVDETIQVLSLISTESNIPMSPTLLTSPIIDTMSRKRSTSPVVFERTGSESNANSESTPVSPTSPVVADWAQFSLSGFGDAPATQPLVALLEQDDDIEVTQPQLSRKSSRQRGKSRSGKRRVEDRDPSDKSPSSHPDHRSSVMETKLASVHAVQVDEAFIDFWSDAIVDPISVNWPTFVVCGLKQIPNVSQSIRWLIIEQTYSRQQPQNSRGPSPDGKRGRSPRPSFKSDISGFRINTVFSSARKRFSAFSKSATDLELKKSGGRTPTAGELGEILVEEVAHSVTDTVVATGGATADAADRPKANDIDATPVAGTVVGLAPASKESNPIRAAANALSIEHTPQSGVDNNGIFVQSSVHVEQRSHDGICQEVNGAADLATKTTLLVAEPPSSLSTQGTNDPTVLVTVPAAENSLAAEPQTRAAPPRQDVIEAREQPVKSGVLPWESDELTVVQVDAANRFQGNIEAVANPSFPVPVSVPAVDDQISEPTGDEPHVANQPSRNTPADLLTASTAEPVARQKIDNLPPISATDLRDQIFAVETPAHPEDAITCLADGPEEAEELTEQVEIPTPTPEHVVLVEETPSPDASVDVNGLACSAHVPASGNVPTGDAGPQDMRQELQATWGAGEPSAGFPVEILTLEIPHTDTTGQISTTEAEHAADQVPELATKEIQLPTQGVTAEPTVVDLSVQVDDAPNVAVVETVDTGVPTPVVETTVLVDATPIPEPVIEVSKPCQVTPVIPVSEVAEDKTAEPVIQPLTTEAEVPPTEPVLRVAETQPCTEPATEPTECISEDDVVVDTPTEPTIIASAEEAEVRSLALRVQDSPVAAVEPGASQGAAPSTADNPDLAEDDAAVSVTDVDDAAPSGSELVATAFPVPSQERATYDVQPCVVGAPSDVTVVAMDSPVGGEEISTDREVGVIAAGMQAAHPTPDVVEDTVTVVDVGESAATPEGEETEEASPIDGEQVRARETDVDGSRDVVVSGPFVEESTVPPEES